MHSFINKDILNNTGTDNKCQLEDCECETRLLKEKQGSKETSNFHFATIIMMALAFATILSIVKIEAAEKNVIGFILYKKEKVISCVPGYTNKKNNNDEPADGNNQNNCSHQQASLCETKSSNRRSLKIHNC